MRPLLLDPSIYSDWNYCVTFSRSNHEAVYLYFFDTEAEAKLWLDKNTPFVSAMYENALNIN